jgi:hypothetical protein
MDEGLDEGDSAQVDRFDGEAKFLFLPAASGVNTKITELEDEAFF